MSVFHSVTELIGQTPLLQLHKLASGSCELFLKLENQNPGGSIKDRVALSMINEAERLGLLVPGGTIIEATAGNTGLGLALIAAQKGYSLILVVPDKMSREKIFHLRALGAKVVLTRSDVNKGHPAYYQDYARRLAQETPGAFYIDQFNNEANPLAHATTTAPEIFAQLDGRIDAIVVGVGSGGTLGGLQAWFAQHSPHTEFVLADPAGSILADQVESGRYGEPGSWLVEGIGEDFIPPLAHINGVHKAFRVTDREAFATARELLQQEGILAGSSTGTLLSAALRYCQSQTSPKRVVTFACDSGNKYLSKMFNDDWMRQQGLLAHPSNGDLTDFIALRHDEGATVTAAPEDSLAAVLAHMRLYDISQLPVMENNQLVGIVDEWDLISHVQGDSQRFSLPVRQAMTRNVEILDKHAPESALRNIFDRGLVAVIADNGRFVGLITRSDVLTTWRNRLEQ
ncbi:pyridoxal-phosphate dependent enzyme [Kosakonia oryziphila]|uniref:Cysteine synthase B n=1 Tax=Kosakonia oryziphila TaxID=1005667 RepID=A0A1C4ACI8_9ENTR|nr:cystathionine beta-synthase [Kosakonia oryziphila]SCB92304.1 cystathionine beta-synthase [Kosakonia oryziphila]